MDIDRRKEADGRKMCRRCSERKRISKMEEYGKVRTSCVMSVDRH